MAGSKKLEENLLKLVEFSRVQNSLKPVKSSKGMGNKEEKQPSSVFGLKSHWDHLAVAGLLHLSIASISCETFSKQPAEILCVSVAAFVRINYRFKYSWAEGQRNWNHICHRMLKCGLICTCPIKPPTAPSFPILFKSQQHYSNLTPLKDAAASIFGAPLLENRKQATILPCFWWSATLCLQDGFHSSETDGRGAIVQVPLSFKHHRTAVMHACSTTDVSESWGKFSGCSELDHR